MIVNKEYHNSDETDPNIRPLGPDQTQEVSPVTKDTDLREMLDRVRKEDEGFKRDVKHAIEGVTGKQVKVLDFQLLEGDRFRFTVQIGGLGETAIVEKKKRSMRVDTDH